MKKVLLIIAIFVGIIQGIAQEVTVHVDGQSLESLLTQEQIQSITTLNITGKLANEDYSFLRDNSLPQLKILNLKEADIDTIPKKAFCNYEKTTDYKECSIILPKKMVFIGDSAFYCAQTSLILTGDFPKRGANALFGQGMTLSNDNAYCKLHKDEYHLYDEYYILSTDGKTLYYSQGIGYDIIPDGVEIIEERAFENHASDCIYFPKTLKKIENYAFYNSTMALWNWEFIFLSKEPPTLGKDVFVFCEECGTPKLRLLNSWKGNYLNKDEQWNIFKNVIFNESISVPGSSIESFFMDDINIRFYNSIITCSSPTAVKLEVYTMDAVKVGEAAFANGKATVKVRKTPATYLYIVTYPDGRRESGKVVVKD